MIYIEDIHEYIAKDVEESGYYLEVFGEKDNILFTNDEDILLPKGINKGAIIFQNSGIELKYDKGRRNTFSDGRVVDSGVVLRYNKSFWLDSFNSNLDLYRGFLDNLRSNREDSDFFYYHPHDLGRLRKEEKKHLKAFSDSHTEELEKTTTGDLSNNYFTSLAELRRKPIGLHITSCTTPQDGDLVTLCFSKEMRKKDVVTTTSGERVDLFCTTKPKYLGEGVGYESTFRVIKGLEDINKQLYVNRKFMLVSRHVDETGGEDAKAIF